MATPITNFGLVTVSGTYGAGDTSITLTTGHGSKLPETTGGYTYPLTWWDATNYAHPADDPNVEIVTVTSRSSDTLTVTRAQESTSASTKNTGSATYRMSLGVTKAILEALRIPKSTFYGVQLQTHRDSDLAATQVELVDVDSIIMNDGTELRNDNDEWTGKTASSAASGAGGLDSGTIANSTWYEIHAIAKEDGTRGLLLHEAPLWAVSTNSVTGEDASQGIRSNVDNSTVKVSQGFIAASGKVQYIGVKLLRVGSPTGKIWFTIETNSGGVPSGTVVATSQAYDVARLPVTATWLRFVIKTSNTLSGSVTYHLVAQGSWTVSGSNYVAWRMDGSAGGFSAGAKSLYDSDTAGWTADTDDDMMFEIAQESNFSSLTYPSGYTRSCLLGWVRTEGSANFVPFVQAGRVTQYTPISSTVCNAGTLTGSARYFDLLYRVPPRDLLKVQLALTGTGTSTAIAAVGDLSATDISSDGATTGAQVVLSSPTIVSRPGDFRYMIASKVNVMVHGTGGAELWVTGFEW